MKLPQQINVSLSLIKFKEENVHIIYSPALDLSGYGNTEEEANASFQICLEEFFKYTLHKKTFNTVLTNLGWKINRKNDLVCQPPQFDELITRNEYFSSIVREKEFSKIDKPVLMPVYR